METAQSRSFDNPDEVRRFPNGEGALIHLGGVSIGIGRLHPGWSFESSMKELVGKDSCPFRHVGYSMSGRLSVRMDDGTELQIGPKEAYIIPAGHHAQVEGDEDFVGLEFDAGALADFGKAQAGS
jgi:hypothetical protein